MPLKGVLGSIDVSDDLMSMARLIFWCLVIGAAASVEQDEHVWVVQQVGAMCTFLGVRDWDGARGVVRGVLWSERESELMRSLVWAEVERQERQDALSLGN